MDWIDQDIADQNLAYSNQTPGGTFLGNLLRVIASGASGGILGQGKNKLNANGTYGNGDNSSTISDVLASLGYITTQTPQGYQIAKDSSVKYVNTTAANNWLWLLIIGVMGVMLIMVSNKK